MEKNPDWGSTIYLGNKLDRTNCRNALYFYVWRINE
jgi:hypothetical protein